MCPMCLEQFMKFSFQGAGEDAAKPRPEGRGPHRVTSTGGVVPSPIAFGPAPSRAGLHPSGEGKLREPL